MSKTTKLRLSDKLAESVKPRLNNLSVTVYPVPTSKEVRIDFSKKITQGNIKIFNAIGQMVDNNTIENSSFLIIDLSKQATGIYWLTVNCDKHFERFKIIKSAY